MKKNTSKDDVQVPLASGSELYKYSTTLLLLTQGRATHARTFHAYEEVPSHEVPKLVEAAKKEREELAAAR